MREIKFRAWDKKNGTMREVYLVGGNLIFEYENNGYDFLELEIKELYPEYLEGVEDFEIMQYTGLNDRIGVEIYEGDIVKYFRNELAVIVYRNGGVDIRSLSWEECEPLQRRLGEIEVVGNIYETPELLEVVR